MKRSEINRIIREADDFLGALRFHLPPFAYWTPERWRSAGPEHEEIVANQLGWDITDFGSGNFSKTGLFLFTLRNGSAADSRGAKSKTYAEKIMLVGIDQVTPMHFHWSKSEDIINRGGGTLAIQLYNADSSEELDREKPVDVSVDGTRRRCPPGHVMRLKPGESITLETGLYHQFWGEDSKVLVGEVSAVNDDQVDNRFLKPAGRFPDISEDEAPLHLLVGDYPDYFGLA